MPKINEKKIVLTLIVLHLAVALPLAFHLNIWADEASTLHTTRDGFFTAFHNLFADEKQAPIYFLLLSLWRKINGSIFFARLFSIVCSAAAIAVFSNLARKIWDEKTAVFITAAFALHPYLFWASLEIRLYSMVILLTCLLFTFFYDGYLREDFAGKKARIYYVLTSIVALYTNYYLGFALVGGFAALLVLRRWRAARSCFWQMCVVGITILPLLGIIFSQFSDLNTFQPEKSAGEGFRIIWNHFLTFALPTEIFTPENTTVISIIRLWLVRVSILAVIGVFIKNKFAGLDKNITAFGTIAVVCAAFLLFVYSRLGAGFVEIRHAAIYFTAIFIFVSAILIKILPEKARIVCAFLYAVFFIYAVASLYPNLTKRGDWARVSEFIERSEQPNQPIIIFPVYDALALPVYYRGANKILTGDNFFAFAPEAEAGSPNAFRRQIEFTLGKSPPAAIEVWLLTGDNCDVGQSCEPLENFVQANYTVIDEKDFYKEKVRLLRKK